MTPLLDALRALDDRAQRPRQAVSQASEQLLRSLRQIAAKNFLLPRGGSFQIPPQEQDEMVQLTLLRLFDVSVPTQILRKHPQLADDPDAFERSCWAYLSAMVRNAHLAAAKRAGRHVQPLGPAEEATEPAEQPAVLLATRTTKILQRAAAELVRTPGKRDPHEVQRQLTELSDLCVGRVSMNELIEQQGAGPNPSPEDFVQVRNRLQQRHCRLRKALLEVIDRMEEAGQLTAPEADLGRLSLRTLLLRVQRKKGSVRTGSSAGSPGGEDA